MPSRSTRPWDSTACSGGPDAAFSTFRAGNSFLNLQLDPTHAPINDIWGRVIFWVDDVDATYERARVAGFVAFDAADRCDLGRALLPHQ